MIQFTIFKKKKNGFICWFEKRNELIEEMMLRKVVRKIVEEAKKEEKKQETLEENYLRDIIKKVILMLQHLEQTLLLEL